MKDSDRIVNDLRNNVMQLIECNEQPIEEAGRKSFLVKPDGPLKTLRMLSDAAKQFAHGDPECLKVKEKYPNANVPTTPEGWRQFFDNNGYNSNNSKYLLQRIKVYQDLFNKLFAQFFKQVEDIQNQDNNEIDFNMVMNDLNNQEPVETEEQTNI